MSSSSYSYEVGDKVGVLYDPARPLRSNIDSFSAVWLGPLLMIVVSLVTIPFMSIWFYVARIMAQRRQDAN
ncbi:MAG TPA: DUF3592 domain-containing protein [Verrucomicrobiae bacterium]|jgi:hypothetical protein|nr:DUF3592 domain-containing protein [Verrucomicrobiae bacterium]